MKMIIRDYLTPEGRVLAVPPTASVIFPVKIRFLTPEERERYGCDDLAVRKKVCCCCGEEKSAYRFFPSTTVDGLSRVCKACQAKTREQHREQLHTKRRKGRKNRGIGKANGETAGKR